MELIDSDIKYELEDESGRGARIKVLGVGGAGTNAVARMIHEGLEGVEFCAINTDLQALEASAVPNRLHIGAKITNGLGAGSDPALGRRAALEDTDRIVEILHGADMVFVAAGLGGGTGGGAAPVVASLAKELDALTVAVITKPFTFEGSRRMRQADQSLAELASSVDTLIAIPNDRLLTIVPKGTTIPESFRVADDVLRQAVQGISDIITTPGLINLDFSDIKATMVGMGYAMLGTATGTGENAVVEAARQAINCPLFEDSRIKGSRRILVNITGSKRLGLHEVNEACSIIREAAEREDVQLSFGVIVNDSLSDSVKVTVIATGFQPENAPALHLPRTERVPEPLPLPERVEEQLPFAAEPNIAETVAEPPGFDPDDLDTPAYLRQGRLLN